MFPGCAGLLIYVQGEFDLQVTDEGLDYSTLLFLLM